MKKRMLALSALLLSMSTAMSGMVAGASSDEVTDSTGFAQCEEYINIRSDADTSSEIVGKIYNNGYMEILDETEDGWYHIKSGNVEGYIAAQYVAVGEEAAEIAETTGYRTAEVGAISLNIRQDKSTDSEVVAAAEEGDKLEVVADGDDWIKVVSDEGTYGYVSSEYVHTSVEYSKAETPEEEQARLDREWLAYLEAQGMSSDTVSEEASSDSAESYEEADTTETASDTSSGSDETYTEPDYSYSEETASDAGQNETYAEETEAPYVEETEAPYVEETEAPYVEETEAPYVEETEAPYVEETEAPYVEETEAPYVEETEAPYVEETEAPYVEETEASSGDTSSSSTGQAVADYAVQFVGNPYVYGGSSLTNGADCSGFTMSVFANFGISLPHYSGSQMGYGTAVDASSLQAGDLVFYGAGGSQHVAIYIGGGQIVHAANSSSGIIISDMYWPGTPTGYRRLV